MAYANFNYYTTEYLCGKDATLSESDFPYYEKQARYEVDAMTHNSIRYLTNVPAEVKECVCAIAEHLYKVETLTNASVNSGLAGVLTSYSNDGESGTVDASGGFTASGSKEAIKGMIKKYLLNTGLLYGGVFCAES